jgi:hypothetical protein
MTPAVRHTACAAFGDGIWLVGGTTDNDTPLDSLWRATVTADGELGAFAALATTLTAPRLGHEVAVVDDELFVLGGEDIGGSVMATIESADLTLATPSFSPEVGTLASARSHLGSFVIHEELWLAGGHGASVPLDTVECASLGDSVTTPCADLFLARAGLATVVTGNSVYTIGGVQLGTSTNLGVATGAVLADATPVFSDSGFALTSHHVSPAVGRVGTDIWVLGGALEASPQHEVLQLDNVTGRVASVSTIAPSLAAPVDGEGVCLIELGNHVHILGDADGSGVNHQMAVLGD